MLTIGGSVRASEKHHRAATRSGGDTGLVARGGFVAEDVPQPRDGRPRESAVDAPAKGRLLHRPRIGRGLRAVGRRGRRRPLGQAEKGTGSETASDEETTAQAPVGLGGEGDLVVVGIDVPATGNRNGIFTSLDDHLVTLVSGIGVAIIVDTDLTNPAERVVLLVIRGITFTTKATPHEGTKLIQSRILILETAFVDPWSFLPHFGTVVLNTSGPGHLEGADLLLQLSNILRSRGASRPQLAPQAAQLLGERTNTLPVDLWGQLRRRDAGSLRPLRAVLRPAEAGQEDEDQGENHLEKDVHGFSFPLKGNVARVGPSYVRPRGRGCPRPTMGPRDVQIR